MTRAATLAVLVAFVLAASPVRLSAQVEPGFLKKVSDAIDHGVDWLKKAQLQTGDDKGSWGREKAPKSYGGAGTPHECRIGITALSLLALLKSDVDRDDQVIKDGFDFIDKHIDKSWKEDNVFKQGEDQSKLPIQTYEVGFLLMAIEAWYDNDGQFHKACLAAHKEPKTVKRPPYTLSPPHQTLVKAAVKWLKDTQTSKGGWRYSPTRMPTTDGVTADASATQVALLGLMSAQRMGVETDPKMLEKALQFNLALQEKDGPAVHLPPAAGQGEGKTVLMKEGDKARGWPYADSGKEAQDTQVSGGMTACGISSLIICKAMLHRAGAVPADLAKKIDRAVFDGLAWLTNNWQINSNPHGVRSLYYYLYGIERVGVLGDTTEIGGHNWYIEGAHFLVEAQKPSGEWADGTEVEPQSVIGTAFALLFLKKGTVPIGSIISPR